MNLYVRKGTGIEAWIGLQVRFVTGEEHDHRGRKRSIVIYLSQSVAALVKTWKYERGSQGGSDCQIYCA